MSLHPFIHAPARQLPVRLTAATLVAVAALALPAHRAAAQTATNDSAYHPRNVKEAASNTGHEAKRVYKRSAKTVAKAADDTKKQAKRTGSAVKRRLKKHRAPADSTTP